MKIGMCEAPRLKERGEEIGLVFADALWGYMVEDMMLRIYHSSYKDLLWLESRNIMERQAYERRSEKPVCFMYVSAERAISSGKMCPGQKLSIAMCEQMIQDIFVEDNSQEIFWRGEAAEDNGAYQIHLIGTYKEMQVPMCLILHSTKEANQRPDKQETVLTVIRNRKLCYWIYAPENQLSRDLYEIVYKLELIGDMSCYARVYDVLTGTSLSGRYVLEELSTLTSAYPNMRKEQRLAQLAEYESYAYMRKRWEKYERNQKRTMVEWKDVLKLVLEFLTPVWHSLCCDEIFFDDWMPELRRFLG